MAMLVNPGGCLIPVLLALEKLRQEDCHEAVQLEATWEPQTELQASLNYKVRPCPKKAKRKTYVVKMWRKK